MNGISVHSLVLKGVWRFNCALPDFSFQLDICTSHPILTENTNSSFTEREVLLSQTWI